MIVVVIVTRKLGDEQSESGHVNFIYCSVQKVNIEAAHATHITFHVSASSKAHIPQKHIQIPLFERTSLVSFTYITRQLSF